MNELTEKLREKYRDEGFAEGANTERLTAIKVLKRVADSDDIEGALLAEIDKLQTIQATEVSAAVLGKSGSQLGKAQQLAAAITTAQSTGGKDLVDTLADMLRAQRGTL
ncbi:MAG TPA: hypothetical protein VHW01_05260 [Polyangiaceae bacterium]|jgi:hypothetical protein|nr:hypothetical protein [Polyangiaceae bacterium]